MFLGFSSLHSSFGLVLPGSRPIEIPPVVWKLASIPIFKQVFSKVSSVTEIQKSTKINFSVICYLYVSLAICFWEPSLSHREMAGDACIPNYTFKFYLLL